MSGIYRSIQQAQAAIERWNNELESKSKLHSKLSLELVHMEERINQVEINLNSKRAVSHLTLIFFGNLSSNEGVDSTARKTGELTEILRYAKAQKL